jgi:DNA-binding transcriptional MerR regulator
MAKSKERLLTAKEAVTDLGISLSTLHKVEKQGLLIPFRTPGGHRRYDHKMLDDYLQSSRRSRKDTAIA